MPLNKYQQNPFSEKLEYQVVSLIFNPDHKQSIFDANNKLD